MYRTLRAFFLFAIQLALFLGTVWAFFRLPFSWFVFLLPVVIPLLKVFIVAVVGRSLLPSPDHVTSRFTRRHLL